MKLLLMFVIVTGLLSCSSSEQTFDSQGHRGCRGLLPENTIPGFKKALDLGVQTLELDCVISGDSKVVVSHEAYFNHEISTGPNGEEITEENDKELNLYSMTYDSIKAYDVGIKAHSRFPTQEKMAIGKPLLSDVIVESDQHAKETGRALPYYNIEIKRVKDYDGIYNPPVEEFVDLVLSVVYKHNIQDRTTIQSFDLESLQLTHDKNPDISTALLIQNMKSPAENIEELGYKPSIYSCYFKLLNEESMTYLKSENIKVIPWTVNTEKDISETIALGIDGIISDYPDRVNKVMSDLGR